VGLLFFLFVIGSLRSCDRFPYDLFSEDESNTHAKKDMGRDKLDKPFIFRSNLAI